jgi:hypothetical protein
MESRSDMKRPVKPLATRLANTSFWSVSGGGGTNKATAERAMPTIDQSDIRGSAFAAFMVMIRREQARTRCAGFGLSRTA